MVTQDLIELSYCKLKKIYVLYQNFIYAGLASVPLDYLLSGIQHVDPV